MFDSIPGTSSEAPVQFFFRQENTSPPRLSSLLFTPPTERPNVTSDPESLQKCDKNMTPPVPINRSLDPCHFSFLSPTTSLGKFETQPSSTRFPKSIKLSVHCVHISPEIREESLIHRCFRGGRNFALKSCPRPTARLQRGRTILETKVSGSEFRVIALEADRSWNYQGQ